MNKISLMPSLLSTTGWFIGLLAVMIIVTALFATVLVIALKPIKKFEPDDDMSKKLERRETELTIQLLKNSNDPKRTEALLNELREVTAAEKMVNKIIERENAALKADGSANKPSEKKKTAPARQKPEQQANAQTQQQAKPRQGAPAQQGQPKPQQQGQPAQQVQQKVPQQGAPAQQGQPKPQQQAQPAQQAQQKVPQQGAPAQQGQPKPAPQPKPQQQAQPQQKPAQQQDKK